MHYLLNRKKNFQYHQEYVDVKWIDDVRIKIGDRKLNILKDVYDSRH